MPITNKIITASSKVNIPNDLFADLISTHMLLVMNALISFGARTIRINNLVPIL